MRFIHIILALAICVGLSGAIPSQLVALNQLNLSQPFNSQLHGVLNGDEPQDATTVYQSWGKLNKTGDTLSGNLSAGSYWITNLANGTGQGAATVSQVTAAIAAQTGIDPTRIDWSKNINSQIHGVIDGDAAQDAATVNQLDAAKMGWINVKDYGAIGDNSTDDSDAIQAAINSSMDGCYVYFPEGKYITTKTIYAHSGVSLIGAGWTYGYYTYSTDLNGSYLVKGAAWDGPMIEYNAGGVYPLEGGFSMYNMALISNHVRTGTGIRLVDAYNWNIERCLVDGMIGYGVELIRCGTGTLTHCQIFATMPGEMGVYSCGVYLDQCNDLRIYDNDIGTADYLRAEVSGIYQNSGWALITDNIIFNGYYGVLITGWAIVSNNRVNDCYQSCIYLATPNNVVVGNHLISQTTGPWSPTFVALSTAPASGGSVVAGNVVSYSGAEGGQYGMYINNISTVFSGNSGNMPMAIPQVSWSDVVPSSGYHWIGSVVWNSTPAGGSAPGWVCTVSGSPGTWKAMAALSA